MKKRQSYETLEMNNGKKKIFKCWPHLHRLRTTAFTTLCLLSAVRTTGGQRVQFPEEKGITEHSIETAGSECLSSLTDGGMDLSLILQVGDTGFT